MLPAPPVAACPLEPPLSDDPTVPAHVAACLWRGSDLGSAAGDVVPSGFPSLDAELPGGGWPCRAVAELLSAQPGVLEWRVLAGCLRAVTAAGRTAVLVSPPRVPHLPGLRHEGLDERQLVWIDASTPSERLWCTEQLVKSGACGAIVAWLPQARPEQVRRLQVCASSCDGPVLLCRPTAARHEPSAAPLRVHAALAPDWTLRVQVLKRRGAAHDGELRLHSIPGGLARVLTPRLLQPNFAVPAEEFADAAVGRAAPRRRVIAAH